MKGEWPGKVSLSHLWHLAEGRPWNDHRPDAYMRLVRGTSGFLEQAAETLLRLGANSIISPPLTPNPQTPWLDAGFRPYVGLRLLSRHLDSAVSQPAHTVLDDPPNWDRVLEIDELGFGREWCASRLALEEALRSTGKSVVFTVADGEVTAGYAICAAAGTTGYLQRIAVHPDHRRRGFGRSLLTAGYAWMRRTGARRVLLNTKPDNAAALDLYRAEGFRVLADRLQLLKYG